MLVLALKWQADDIPFVYPSPLKAAMYCALQLQIYCAIVAIIEVGPKVVRENVKHSFRLTFVIRDSPPSQRSVQSYCTVQYRDCLCGGTYLGSMYRGG